MLPIRASLLTLVLAFVPAAHADEAGEKLVRDYIAALDASPGWSSSAKAVRSDGSKVIVEDWTAALESGAMKKSSAEVVLDGVTAGQNGALKAASWSVRDGKLETASSTASIPSWTASDLAVPLPPAIGFDPAKPFSSLAAYYRLAAELSFGRIDIPAMTFSQSFEVPGADGKPQKIVSDTTYTGFALDNALNGRIARITLAQTTSRSTVPPPETGTWSLTQDGIEAIDTDLAALSAVLDPSAYKDGRGDGQWRDVLKSMTVAKVSAALNGKEIFSTGAWDFQGMRLRQTEKPIAEVMDRLMSMTPPVSDAAAMELLSRDMPTLIGFYGFDRFSIADMKGGEPGLVSVALKRFLMEGLDGNGLKRFALEDLTGSSPEFAGAMKLFALDGIEWPRMSAWTTFFKLRIGQPDAPPPTPAQAEEAASAMLDIYPKYARIAIEGLSGGPPGQTPISLDRIFTTVTSHVGSYPMSYEGGLDNLVIPGWVLRADPSSAQVFDTLGYSELVFGMTSKAAHDEKTGDVVSQVSLTGKDAGVLRLAIDLGGLTEASMRKVMTPFMLAGAGSPPIPEIVSAFGDISFKGFTLRFEDASLTARLLSFAAKMQGMDEQTLIGNVGALLQLGLSELKNPAFTQELVAAATAFLKDPKSITIRLKPPAPVTANQIVGFDPSNPGAAIGLLGASVTAND